MTVYSYRWLVILMLLFFISPAYLCSQNKIDSLKNALPPLRDSGRIDCLNALSETYRNLRVFDSSRRFALQSAEESGKLNYIEGRGTAFYNLGTVEYELNDFTGAENASKLSIGIFEKIHKNILLAKSYVSYGKAIWAQSRFDEANIAFNKATELFAREADSGDLGATYGLMALEEEERGNYEKSFEFAIKAQSLNYENAAVALGQLYADVGDYETALDYYAKVSSNNVNLFKYLKVGEAFYLQKKYDSAIFYYQSYIRETGALSKKLLSKPYALLGTLYLEMKQYDTALVYLRQALKDFRKSMTVTGRCVYYWNWAGLTAKLAIKKQLLISQENSCLPRKRPGPDSISATPNTCYMNYMTVCRKKTALTNISGSIQH